MARITDARMKLIWTISIALFVIFLVIGIISFFGILPSAILIIDDWIIIGIIVMIGPPAIAYWTNQRWYDGIDENLPQVLRDIADAQRTGLSLTRAVTESSKRAYGPLTPELEKMASKISWGVSFEESLESFAESANTPLVRRSSILILEAERYGGASEDIFDSAHSHTSELLTLRKERLGQMKPYLYTVYMAFLVFLFVCIILVMTFFVPLAGFAEAGIAGAAGSPFGTVDVEFYKRLFLHMLMIEALFGGLVAGQMGEGNMKSGLKHSLILLTLGYVSYKAIVYLNLVPLLF